jgi:NitT/TauT family transport system ATP-binding protein
MSTTMHLQVHNVSKIFESRSGRMAALGDVSFQVDQGEFVALVGPSGCGKSTLLRLVAGLLQPTAGAIHFAGWPTQPRCAMVFQEASLLPWLRVVENVAFGLEAQGVSAPVRRQRADDLLQRMGLAAFANHYPHELSGGMRQRVGIARAWLTEPAILLMDEPFRALDAQTRLIMQEELLHLCQARRPIVLYVTHDIDEALLLANRVLVMSGRPGHIQAEIPVPLPRPRELTGRKQSENEEIKWRIWYMLEQEVRQSLHTTAVNQP